METLQPHGNASVPQPVRLAVPLYVYPGSNWTTIEGQNSSVGFVIMNPNSGPGTSRDPTYASSVSEMQAEGVQVIGYVHTSYATGEVSLAQAETWVTDYYTWYGVDGIFFDEASDVCNASSVHYYSTLYNFTKNQSGADLVVLNPGTATGACYAPISNVIVTFEDTYANYTTQYVGMNWTEAYPTSHFWNIVYSVPVGEDLATVLTLAHERGAGWVYATSLGLPNPYDSLGPLWNESVNLTAPLRAGQPTSTPTGPKVGSNLTLAVNVSGGGSTYTYSWSGLPPGCSSTNSSVLRCHPAASGTFSVSASVSDPEGAWVPSPTLSLTVVSRGSPSLNVSIAPRWVNLSVGANQSFRATVTCGNAPCPSGVGYSWELGASSVGSISPADTNLTYFQAGNRSGTAVLWVDAGWNQSDAKEAEAIIEVLPLAPRLGSVSISPAEQVVPVGSSISLEATIGCLDGACPAGAQITWSLSNGLLGTLNSTDTNPVLFTANESTAQETVTVNVSLEGVSRSNESSLQIVQPCGCPVRSTPFVSPLLISFLVVLAATLIAVGVWVWSGRRRRRLRASTNPAPLAENPGLRN